MIIKLTESNKHDGTAKFGLENDEFTFSSGIYPDNTYEHIQIPKDTYFENWVEFVTALNKYCNYKIPLSTDNYSAMEFDNLTSKLTLGWEDDSGEWHNLYAILYNAPAPMTKYDLKKYGIELK